MTTKIFQTHRDGCTCRLAAIVNTVCKPNLSMEQGDRNTVPLLAANSFWEIEALFSLRLWSLINQPCPHGRQQSLRLYEQPKLDMLCIKRKEHNVGWKGKRRCGEGGGRWGLNTIKTHIFSQVPTMWATEIGLCGAWPSCECPWHTM